MDKDTRKSIEQALLAEIDQLIECGIEASQVDEDQRPVLLAEGQALVQRVLGLLNQIFFGPGDYYETILKQLVSQKLPESHILASFGDFPDIMEQIIAAGTSRYAAEEPVAQETTEAAEEIGSPVISAAEPVISQTESNLEDVEIPETLTKVEDVPVGLIRSLRLLFPRARVVNDFVLDGLVLPYFLPDYQLAFEEAGWDIDRRKLHICQQNGISLVRISREDVGEHKRIQREIRRQTRSAKKSLTLLIRKC